MLTILVTGACGFIGTNLCLRLLALGHRVVGVDNFSRKGSKDNWRYLTKFDGFTHYIADVSIASQLEPIFQAHTFNAVFHLAAQVAVTLSYENMRKDFNINALGSFNVLELARKYSPSSYCLYASTNKVFGHIQTQMPVNNASFPLSPYTPYGVSKAVGELYFSEFGTKELGMTTCSLRQSCIYGTHQYGIEDQGWVAWFALANLREEPINIYGDGKQCRDLLFIDDLIDLYIYCMTNRISGTYPVGGGPTNAVSIVEGLGRIATITKLPYVSLTYHAARAGDQPYFVADLTEIGEATGWKPKVNVDEGLARMIDWMQKDVVCSLN